ncbi:hypothetical protein O181_002369 [Austropuccinia psidii MF-1]|uniref:Uncharacterized protein n=1 Tax=Austropuccinia psidii MF-1 TaxID=1389203 RepID=A0A9Q3GCS5_9BASI|nr:hypothetical protein [Austropuccinia psidii MF-1]
MNLDLVNVKVCPQILSYIILGKLASNSNVTQIVDLCILNNQLTEHPNQSPVAPESQEVIDEFHHSGTAEEPSIQQLEVMDLPYSKTTAKKQPLTS